LQFNASVSRPSLACKSLAVIIAGHLNMTDFNNIHSQILLQNNQPIDDFLGLSSNEVHHLIYDTLGANSPVQFQSEIDDRTLDQIPLFLVAEAYLKIINRDKSIKLTPLGALPKKVFVEVYEKKYLLDEHIESGLIKLWKEDDWIAIKSARLSLELAGLVKKLNGKLILTKKAEKYFETKNRTELFKQFFHAFTDKFNWCYNDGYPEHPIGQLGWAFTAILLDKYGDTLLKSEFYAEKYLKAFPKFITFFKPEYTTAEKQYLRCYAVRTFERFFLWFGFVKVDNPQKILKKDLEKYVRTDLLRKVFRFDKH